jgi:membrane protease YdiL (CAAX protease family)
MRGYPLIRKHLLDVASHPALKAVAVIFGTAAAIVEEVWFRRLPMDWAAGRGWGPLAQVALAAVLFALPHAVWGLAARSARVLVGSVAATGLLGAALAIVYLAAGRVLAPCIWAHTAINVLLEP